MPAATTIFGNGNAQTGLNNTIPSPVVDSSNLSYSSSQVITSGAAIVNAGRAIGMVVTNGGSITLTLVKDGSQLTIPVNATNSFVTLPFSCSMVVLGSGVTGSFWNLP